MNESMNQSINQSRVVMFGFNY